MVNAVVGRRIEDVFDGARQFMHRFGMDPELIDETDLLHEDHYNGIETDQWHPEPEKKTAGEIAGPGLTQCRR